MKYQPKTILAFMLFWGVLSALRAGDITVTIRYFDKRIYYIQEASGSSGGNADPIYVQVTISNNSPSAYRFKLADERAFSVDFDIRTMTNRMVEASERLIRRRTENRQVFFREVAVESGESFSFMEDIRDYADLNRSGAFVVQAKLYPELLRPDEGAAEALESNRLSLSLRPLVLPGPGGIPLEMDTATNALLVREKLPPDRVIDYILTARQKSQWEKYVLYLDLESMISRDPVRRRQWLAESEEGQQRMLTRYRTELQSSVIDGDIAAIPMDFEIERTTYNNEEGTVIVLEKFRIGNYTERRRYTYYLRRRDDIWTVVDYSVVNLGTE
ncbi:MAG: hypothetical protein LBJ24_01255 [Treponema sp.]|nr:hypothetical protein [Treponema sp.]